MTHWNRVRGDVNDTVTVRLIGGVVDFTAATSVVGHVSYGSGAFEVLPGVIDVPNRLATLDLGDATGWLSDAALGCWRLRTVVTFAGGATKTWPETSSDEITVGPA